MLLGNEALKEAVYIDGLTQLHFVAGAGRGELVRWWHYNSLTEAARRGCVEVIRILPETGAKIESAFKDGSTPLIVAARWGYVEVVRILLSRGADIDAIDKDGWTSLHDATQAGSKVLI